MGWLRIKHGRLLQAVRAEGLLQVFDVHVGYFGHQDLGFGQGPAAAGVDAQELAGVVGKPFEKPQIALGRVART